MEPPLEIPKKKLRLDVTSEKINFDKNDDDDVASIDSSALGEDRRVLCQLCSEEGESIGDPIDLPLTLKSEQLQLIAQAFVAKQKESSEEDDDDSVSYAFYVENSVQITKYLSDAITAIPDIDTEKAIKITVQPQAFFKVQSVTRCTSSLPGHAEAVISVAFSPDGRHLATGSGDTTVRLWDLATELPQHTCSGHGNWVLAVSWSPDGAKLASADKNGHIIIWDPESGKQTLKPFTGHKQWVTYLSWEPLHVSAPSRRLASASKDATVKIWDTTLGTCELTLAGHTAAVTCVRWGGSGLIYSSSQDRTIKVWRASDGVMCRTLSGHAHWVNTLALSTDYALRTGAFDPAERSQTPTSLSSQEMKRLALKRYDSLANSASSDAPAASRHERLLSGSDDFTLFLWRPEAESKPVARLTGHMQLVNDVKFSPDGRRIASASFDKSIKMWDGRTGKYICSLRGHVGPVYQISWSADSRLLVSGSADSTLKVWDVSKKKILKDLPGHADEVYAVDWSPDGVRVASGGKDKILKLWRK